MARRPSHSSSARRKAAKKSAAQHGAFGGGRDVSTAARSLSPDPRAPLPAVWLRSPVRQPLVYRKRILKADNDARPGDMVAVYVAREEGSDELFGYGLYNPRSEIAVRMLRWGSELPDAAYWQKRFQHSVSLRRELLRLDEVTDTYRVIHGEADGLPGLVIDRFGDVLSAEAFSLGMFQRAQEVLDTLASLCGTQHWLIQPGPQTLAQEGFDSQPILSPHCPRSVIVHEFGTQFRVQFEGGHKTGFFCDQRDNRRMLASFCPGRSVLDLCCYSGGFSVQAAKLGGAADVTGVDLDEEPLKTARENAQLNKVDCRFVQADVFPYMRDMLRLGKQFDVIVLDPPKLIRSRSEIEEGTRKHFDLNRLAMQLVRPGGLLLSCTCAGLLPWEEFLKIIYSAARQAGGPAGPPDAEGRVRHLPRSMQILAKTGAAACHPVDSTCLETEYLKAVWMRMG
jgi:23S rRNA (cytosine1962-C5)-methyltransferase